MDDFDYSVQISELDWNTFFQECEECDLLPPALAGLEDSGMSDADDASSSLSSRDPHAALDTDLLEPDDPIDGLPDSEGCPVENYFSACDLPCPEDVLSCSEEDRHLESVNVFFERLKSMTEGGSFHAEAKPKGTGQGEEPAKHPAHPIGLSESKCSTDNRQRLTGAESTGSEQEDEVGGSANPAVDLVIREEEWSAEPASEGRKQEQEVQSHKPSKDAVLGSEVLSLSFRNNEHGNKPPERKFQGSELREHEGVDGGARRDEMASQPPPWRPASPSGPHNELHSERDILFGEGAAETPEHHPLKSQKKKQKERWFVSVGGSQESSREHASPLLKKKRKKLGSSRDSLATGRGCEGESTESETEAETFQQGAAAQGKGQAKHDRTACRDETGSGHNSFSVQQTDGENDLLKQQKLGIGPHLQIHSQHSHQNSIPVKTAEKDDLSAFEPADNIPQNSHSSGITIDSTLQQPTGLHEPETNGGSEQSFATESDRLSIVEENLPEQNHMTKEQKLQRNSEVDKNASDQQALLELSCSAESPQCDKSFVSDTISGSEDSRRLDLPGYGYTSTHEQNMLPFSQESSDLDNTGRSEVSSPREFLIEVPYGAELTGPTGSSVSLNNTGSQGSADTVCITEQDEERPPEYQEVEDTCDIPTDGDDSTHLQPTPEDSHTGNIIPQTNSAFSALESDQPATAANNQSYLPLEELKTSDEQGKLRQPDLTTESPGPCHTAIPQLSYPTEISSENDAKDSKNKNSENSAVAASENDKGNQTDEPVLAKPGCMTLTDSGDCVNSMHANSLQSSVDVAGDNEVEIASVGELQNKNAPPEGTILVHTPALKTDSQTDHESSLPQEPVASAKPLEVEKAPDSPCPVYAMSSFWQEMEKLTINDILRLRLVGNAQTPGGLLRPQDASTADPSEAGDSGYSSHLEDSKPDRSSGDISTISDFEEECLPSHSASVNPSPEPQDTERQGQRSLGSSSSRGVLWESEPDPISTGVDNGLEGAATLHAEDANPTLFRSSSAKQGFRRMCKNISVQNLRALETEPHVNQASRNASPCTIVMEEEESKEYKGTYYESKETCNSVPLESRSNAEASATSSLPEDVFTGGYVFSFPEIFEYLFGADETKTGHTDAACTDLPVCNEGSVPEMYDHFFSEFETGNFFLPLIQGSDKSQSEPVPIFSCSRFSKRNMQFPEAYDYFFPDDSPVESSEDEDDHSHDRAPIRVVTRFDKVANTPQGAAAAPDMYEHFFADNDCRDNLFWRNPLSLRRLFFGGLTGSKQMSPPFALQPTDYQRNTVLSTIYPDSAVGNPGPASPQSPLYCLEERIFRELAEQQMRYGDLQNAVAIARPDSSLLSLKQSDMCLICIAFASWVLKTANPQDADTWKAALLANISALSAIRYLRRYIREESTTKKP